MAIQTVNPTVNTTPNIGGSSAVDGISNTGHSVTSTGASAVDSGPGAGQNNTTTKTAKWSSFSSFPSGTINSLHLKINWDFSSGLTVETSDSGAHADADTTFTIDYTIDGGSNWINAITRNRSISADDGSIDDDDFSDSGAIDVTLLTSQDVSLVQVRDSMISHASATAIIGTSANALALQDTTISDIKLEADITPAPPAGSGANKVLSVLM